MNDFSRPLNPKARQEKGLTCITWDETHLDVIQPIELLLFRTKVVAIYVGGIALIFAFAFIVGRVLSTQPGLVRGAITLIGAVICWLVAERKAAKYGSGKIRFFASEAVRGSDTFVFYRAGKATFQGRKLSVSSTDIRGGRRTHSDAFSLESLQGFILTTMGEWTGEPIPRVWAERQYAILADLGFGDHRLVCRHCGPKNEVVRLHGILTEVASTSARPTRNAAEENDLI